MAEAFRPWLERCNHQPTAEQILALKVCDPAMGSGAFLVAVCRYLAGWLVKAWEREGYPEGFKAEWDKDNVARRPSPVARRPSPVARRLIARRPSPVA